MLSTAADAGAALVLGSAAHSASPLSASMSITPALSRTTTAALPGGCCGAADSGALPFCTPRRAPALGSAGSLMAGERGVCASAGAKRGPAALREVGVAAALPCVVDATEVMGVAVRSG